MRDGSSRAGHESTESDSCDTRGQLVRGGLAPAGPGSVDRGQKTAGGAVECEPTILPGRALT